MAISAFKMLCNHHLCLVPKHFYHPKENPKPIKSQLSLHFPIALDNRPSVLCPYGFTYSGYFI